VVVLVSYLIINCYFKLMCCPSTESIRVYKWAAQPQNESKGVKCGEATRSRCDSMFDHDYNTYLLLDLTVEIKF